MTDQPPCGNCETETIYLANQCWERQLGTNVRWQWCPNCYLLSLVPTDPDELNVDSEPMTDEPDIDPDRLEELREKAEERDLTDDEFAEVQTMVERVIDYVRTNNP